MADNDDVSGSPDRDVDAAAQPVVAAEAAPAPILKTRWRDRAWSFRAMLAVALAMLVIGGIAGGTIVALADDDGGGNYHRMGPWGPGGPMMGGPGWRGNGPRHFNDGGPQWRWHDGPHDPELTPYDGTTPGPPTSTPSG